MNSVVSSLAGLLKPMPSISTLWMLFVSFPGVAQDGAPNFAGVWSSPSTSVDNEGWRFEDFRCTIGCDAEAYAHLRVFASDPANEDLPYTELFGEMDRYALERLPPLLTDEGLAVRAALDPTEDPSLECIPFGFIRTALSPYPMEISQSDGRLDIRYEEWGASRTIYLDGRGPPEDEPPSLLGHSVGRYEGSALIVETTGISANIFWPHWSLAYSDRLRTVERYTVVEDGARLELELTVEDPVMFREPWVLYKPRLSTPDERIHAYDCVVGAGTGR